MRPGFACPSYRKTFTSPLPAFPVLALVIILSSGWDASLFHSFTAHRRRRLHCPMLPTSRAIEIPKRSPGAPGICSQPHAYARSSGRSPVSSGTSPLTAGLRLPVFQCPLVVSQSCLHVKVGGRLNFKYKWITPWFDRPPRFGMRAR